MCNTGYEMLAYLYASQRSFFLKFKIKKEGEDLQWPQSAMAISKLTAQPAVYPSAGSAPTVTQHQRLQPSFARIFQTLSAPMGMV